MEKPGELSQKIARAFDKEASAYRENFEIPAVPALLRQISHRYIAKYLKKGDLVLDLNCGPGPDFPFFKAQGAKVTGLDVSPEMLAQAQKRSGGEELIVLDFNQIHTLGRQFSLVLSNFGGLNTQGDFSDFGEKCWNCLQPGGWLIVNIMTPFPLPEILDGLVTRRHFFRRLRNRKSSRVKVGNDILDVHYFWPKRFFKQNFSKYFQLVELVGLGVFLPPPYGNHRQAEIPRILLGLERILAGRFPFRSWGDHALLVMKAEENAR